MRKVIITVKLLDKFITSYIIECNDKHELEDILRRLYRVQRMPNSTPGEVMPGSKNIFVNWMDGISIITNERLITKEYADVEEW